MILPCFLIQLYLLKSFSENLIASAFDVHLWNFQIFQSSYLKKTSVEKTSVESCIVSSIKFLSIFISTYGKSYSSNHVLITLIENWKQSLDNQKLVGAVLMDLSKAFDCIPQDLLIAKGHAYGFSNDSLKILLSYLKSIKQNRNK